MATASAPVCQHDRAVLYCTALQLVRDGPTRSGGHGCGRAQQLTTVGPEKGTRDSPDDRRRWPLGACSPAWGPGLPVEMSSREGRSLLAVTSSTEEPNRRDIDRRRRRCFPVQRFRLDIPCRYSSPAPFRRGSRDGKSDGWRHRPSSFDPAVEQVHRPLKPPNMDSIRRCRPRAPYGSGAHGVLSLRTSISFLGPRLCRFPLHLPSPTGRRISRFVEAQRPC